MLVLRGVDTVSSVFLNGVPVLNTSNQFVEYFVNIDGLLRDSNTVEVRFTSPVRYAKEKSHEYQVSLKTIASSGTVRISRPSPVALHEIYKDGPNVFVVYNF